jgi:hypothetical protein
MRKGKGSGTLGHGGLSSIGERLARASLVARTFGFLKLEP